MKLTGAAILVSRSMKVLQAAPAAYPYRSAREGEPTAVFFNNCRGRDHAGLFGAGAFYDLNRHGLQATMATNLHRGAECVVASPDADGNIVFSWFAFSHETVMPAEDGVGVRVLCSARDSGQRR